MQSHAIFGGQATGKYFQHFFFFYRMHFETHFRLPSKQDSKSAFVFCCVCWGEMRSSSPVLQYCSSRLVLSYRLPHEATLSDILPSFLISSPALPPLSRVFCPPFTPLSLFFTPSPLPVSPHIHRQTNTHTYTCPSSPSTIPLLPHRQRQAAHYVTHFLPAPYFQNRSRIKRHRGTY